MSTSKHELPVWARWTPSKSTSNHRRIFLACSAIFATAAITAIIRPHVSNADLSWHPTSSAIQTQSQDTFADYIGRDECGINSLDVFQPGTAGQPICPNRTMLLEAMSNGGRIGFDAPYVPRGCDMRWYTSGEACGILGRFDNVMLLGDSLMRGVLFGMNVILRGDLLFGGLREWEIERYRNDVKDVEKCRCGGSLTAYCSPLLIWDSAWLPGNTTEGHWRCSPEAGVERVTFHDMKHYPEPRDRMEKFIASFPAERPKRPIALVVGQGMWNKINETATQLFVKELDMEVANRVPWIGEELKGGAQSHVKSAFHKLYTSPTAGGQNKGNEHMTSQSTNAIGRFERNLRPYMEEKLGYEFLGLWNMSVQATSPDGTHGTLNQNLLMAQMLLNWLDNIDV